MKLNPPAAAPHAAPVVTATTSAFVSAAAANAVDARVPPVVAPAAALTSPSAFVVATSAFALTVAITAAEDDLCRLKIHIAPELRPERRAEVAPPVGGAGAVPRHVRPRLPRGHPV